MVSTAHNSSLTQSESILRRMQAKLLQFQGLLTEEQQAIRSLSFGQFSSVTMRKAQLLEEIRELEDQRKKLAATSAPGTEPVSAQQEEAALVSAIGQTDRMNRFNAALIGQSLEFLEGTLRLWQRSPESAALYSSSGTVAPSTAGRIRVQG